MARSRFRTATADAPFAYPLPTGSDDVFLLDQDIDVSIDGGDGDDTFTVTGAGQIMLEGGAGSDSLTVNYRQFGGRPSEPVAIGYDAATGSLAGCVSANSLPGTVPIGTAFTGVEALAVYFQRGDSIVSVDFGGTAIAAGTALPSLRVEAGSGMDTLRLDLTALAGSTLTAPKGLGGSSFGVFNDFEVYEVTIGAGRHALATGAGDDLVVDGAGGVTTFIGNAGIDTYVGYLGNAAVTVSYDGEDATVSTGTTLDSVEKLDLTSGVGGDVYDLTDVSYASIDAGDGDNRISIAGTRQFSYLEELWVQSGAGADTYTFTGGRAVVFGGAGTDTLAVDFTNTVLAQGSAFLELDLDADGLSGWANYHSNDLTFYGMEAVNVTLGQIYDSARITGTALTSGLAIAVDGGHGADFLRLDLSDLPDADIVFHARDPFTVGSGTFTSFEHAQIIFGAGINRALGGILADSFYGGYSDSTYAGQDSFHGRGGDDVLSGLLGDDLLVGGEGNDRLEGGAGRDRVNGGEGNDIITGGLLTDTLSGGGGADRFDYARMADFGAGGNERIIDFSHDDGDIINLAPIDPGRGIERDQAFTFIGSDTFSAVDGRWEVRTFTRGALQIVEIDADNDGIADAALNVRADAPLVAADFIL
jgi:Ca2+-binding RTX toxin-like protein